MTLTAAEIWRNYDIPGVPASGAHRPVKAEIIEWGSLLDKSGASGAGLWTRIGDLPNGVIQTYGSGASYFPGGNAGATATGGQYA